MKQVIVLLIIAMLIFSCTEKQGNMIVKGKIHNFQKGKIYLEKMKDTLLVKVDSVTLDGSNKYTLSDNVTSPQMYYISISESDKYVSFFGENGIINIVSNLKTFGYNSIIEGSENQVLFDEYKKMNSKFTNLKLDLIKERFDYLQKNNKSKITEIDKKVRRLEKRKYLYTLNFAVRNADFEIAPYLVLTEIRKVNPKLLDTLEKAMSKKVKNSLYGKKFLTFLADKKLERVAK